MKESRWDFPAERRYNFADDMKFGNKGEELTRNFLQSIAAIQSGISGLLGFK